MDGIDQLLDPQSFPPDRDWEITSWTALAVPEQQLSCYVFIARMPNLDLSSVEIWVFDDTAAVPRSFLYHRRDSYLPGGGSSNLSLTADGKKLHMSYNDPGLFGLNIEIAAVSSPWTRPSSTGDVRSRQAGWATGHLVLPDRRLELDDPMLHITHQGPPSRSTGTTYYSYGIGRDVEFHAMWRTNDEGDAQFLEGLIRRGQVQKAIDSGTRVVSAAMGEIPLEIELQLETAEGELLNISGVTVNAGQLQVWSEHHVMTALTQWTFGDIEVWGNDTQMHRATRPRNFVSGAEAADPKPDPPGAAPPLRLLD